MKQTFAILFIGLIFCTPLLSVAAEEQGAPVGLEELIAEAIGRNPELKASEEHVAAFEEKPSQAEALDNPRLGLAVLNLPTDTYRFDQEPMTQKQISLKQRFPFPGKLSLKGDIARKDLAIVKHKNEETKNSLIMQVKFAYWNLLFLDKAIEVTEKNRALLREFVRIAETRYAVGMGIQQDVLKAQVELSTRTDRLIDLRQKRRSMEANLNTLLSRPPHLPVRSGKDIDAVKQTGFTHIVEDLQTMAMENSPSLRGVKSLVERYDLTHALAKKGYYPDFDIGISYGLREETATADWPNFISASITMTIPLWSRSKESRKVAEEKANSRRATERFVSAKNSLLFTITDRMAEIERYTQKIELFRTGLIPQSRASLESALAGYKVNKVDFKTLIDNETTLYMKEIAYYQARAEYEKTLAGLEAVVGKRLF